MNRNIIIVVVLVVLVLITAVQAVQLNGLKNNIATGKVNVGASPPQASSGGAPPSLNELPSMVGGC